MACSLHCPVRLRRAESVLQVGAMQYVHTVPFQRVLTSAWGRIERGSLSGAGNARIPAYTPLSWLLTATKGQDKEPYRKTDEWRI